MSRLFFIPNPLDGSCILCFLAAANRQKVCEVFIDKKCLLNEGDISSGSGWKNSRECLNMKSCSVIVDVWHLNSECHYYPDDLIDFIIWKFLYLHICKLFWNISYGSSLLAWWEEWPNVSQETNLHWRELLGLVNFGYGISQCRNITYCKVSIIWISMIWTSINWKKYKMKKYAHPLGKSSIRASIWLKFISTVDRNDRRILNQVPGSYPSPLAENRNNWKFNFSRLLYPICSNLDGWWSVKGAIAYKLFVWIPWVFLCKMPRWKFQRLISVQSA